MILDYKTIVVVLIGLSMGIGMSFWARYYINTVQRANKIIQVILAFSFFGVVILAIVISAYLFNSRLFEQLDSHLGRRTFLLLWIIPFSVTTITGLVRVAKQKKRKIGS